jgi:hypothetical protein
MLFLPLALAGCGGVGLESTLSSTGGAKPAGDDGGTDAGSDDGGGGADDGGSADLEPVDADLEGRTYVVDVSTLTAVDPPGLDALLATMDSSYLLFHVTTQLSDALVFSTALADSTGAQTLCEPVQDLPPATWSTNPVWSIDRGTFDITLSGEQVTLGEAYMTAIFVPDGSRWDDGTVQAVIDTRELGGVIADGVDACELVESMGGACIPCPDETNLCVNVDLEDIVGEETGIAFDPTVDGTGC